MYLIGANLMFSVGGVFAKQLNRVLRMEPLPILYHTSAVGFLLLLGVFAVKQAHRFSVPSTGFQMSPFEEMYAWYMSVKRHLVVLILNMTCFAVFVLVRHGPNAIEYFFFSNNKHFLSG